jgi:hypothetical protein
VVSPQFLRGFDILLMALLCGTAEENHEFRALPPEIDSVAWTKVDATLPNTAANGFGVRKIA